jgi:pseudouridine synthase
MRARLNKVLARAGLTSRRGADRLVQGGRVTVNGVRVTEPGFPVDPDVDRVAVDGRPLPAAGARVYLVLNKPRGYLSSRRDPRGRPVVTDLVRGAPGRLYPVGRLDADAEGLLLLTNDGALTHRLLHPRYAVARVYEARVEGHVARADLGRWRAGLVLDDGPAQAQDVAIIGEDRTTTLLRLTFHEGRKHEVKRYCEGLGHPVVALRRVAFGPLRLGDLPRGGVRPVTERELRRLRATASLPPSSR